MPPGTRGGGQTLQPTFRARSGHRPPSPLVLPSPLHNTPRFRRAAPTVLNAGASLLPPGLCALRSPCPRGPPSPLTSAEPTSIAEGLIQTLVFQGSPALSLLSVLSVYTSRLARWKYLQSRRERVEETERERFSTREPPEGAELCQHLHLSHTGPI